MPKARQPSSPEKKTKCNFCGAAILKMTTERTGGYCMPHRYLGFAFEERAPARLTFGSEVTLAHARKEFNRTLTLRKDPSDGDSKARFAEFSKAVKLGDQIIEFAGKPVDDTQAFYPTRGFVVVRNGHIIKGVVIESELNESYPLAEADAAGGLCGIEEPIALQALARELADDAGKDRVSDYWGRPV